MGVAGRKLTIRMPDNPRLRTAEVGGLHLDPGARVQSGNPVLTLVHRRREHKVRAPRSGRVVPLIAPGDHVTAGDPLFILHIDEVALETQNREEKALIAVEKEKWTSGVLADAIEPIQRARPEPDKIGSPEFVASWGKPILALALYVLACFALLPILHLFGKTASTPTLIAMVIGCFAFAALIYYLYAPDAGKWPRRVVQLVAASWVGISSVALFYHPSQNTVPSEAAPVGQLARIFDWSEDPLAPAPEQVSTPEPQLAAASGIAVGPSERRSVPDHESPKSVLARLDAAPDPHGVTVRGWARVNPGSGAGAVLFYDHMDRFIDRFQTPPVVLADAVFDGKEASGETVLPSGLVEAPKPAERDPEIVMAAIPSLRDTDPRAAPAPDLLVIEALATLSRSVVDNPTEATPDPVAESASAPQDETAEQPDAAPRQRFAVLRGEPSIDLTASGTRGVPPSVRYSGWVDYAAFTDAPKTALGPALNLYSSIRTADPAWLEDQALALADAPTETGIGPVSDMSVRRQGAAEVLGEVLGITSANAAIARPEQETETLFAREIPMPEGIGGVGTYSVNASSSAVLALGSPDEVQVPRSPGLLLLIALRAGEDTWLLDQSDLLMAQVRENSEADTAERDTRVPIQLASMDAGQIASEPQVDMLSDLIGQAKAFTMSVLPIMDGVWASPGAGPDAQPKIELARLGRPDASTSTAAVGAFPQPDPAPVPPEVQPEVQLAARDLLYLYFDDPRILSHPQVGDPWEGLVSPELGQAIERTEVVDVHEMLQVQNWCGAANDPDGTKRAELGDAYSTAFLNDRIRLLRVRLSVDETALDLLEREIPLFDGTPAGFFHNKAPMLAGLPKDALMERGREHLRSLSAGLFDPNAPDAIGGGQYFDNAFALSIILQGAGCLEASLNDGAGPSNAIGRMIRERLGG